MALPALVLGCVVTEDDAVGEARQSLTGDETAEPTAASPDEITETGEQQCLLVDAATWDSMKGLWSSTTSVFCVDGEGQSTPFTLDDWAQGPSKSGCMYLCTRDRSSADRPGTYGTDEMYGY